MFHNAYQKLLRNVVKNFQRQKAKEESRDKSQETRNKEKSRESRVEGHEEKKRYSYAPKDRSFGGQAKDKFQETEYDKRKKVKEGEKN